MEKANFTVEDIHAIRMETAEKYRSMSPKEAEMDFNQHLKNVEDTMEKIRKANEKTA